VHEGTGLTLEELQHCVNDRCIEAGLLATFKKLLPAREVSHETCHIDKGQTQKWQVCQDFVELNKVTKVPPMPQGDIRTKQQCLSGHRWISTFDFASGFYTCPIPEGQQPYMYMLLCRRTWLFLLLPNSIWVNGSTVNIC